MKISTLIVTSLLLLGSTQLHAQSDSKPDDGKPTGGVGPGTSNGQVDGNPTPGGPGDDKSAPRKKTKRAGTEGTQSGAKPGTPMPDPAPNTPGTSGKATPGSSNTQSGKKAGEPAEAGHDYGPGNTETPTPR